MSKLISWRDDWSLGIDTLDRDHRALMERLIDIYLRHCPQTGRWGLSEGGARGPSGPTLLDELGVLRAETDAHFRREERFMNSIGFAGVSAHAAEHARLTGDFDALLETWRAAGVRSFDDRALDRVRQPLLGHILTADRAFADVYHRLCKDGRQPETG